MPLNAIPIFSETAPRRPPGRTLNMKLSKRDVVLAGLGAKRSHGSLGVRPKPVRSSAENDSAVRSQIAVKVASLWSNVEYPCHKPAERTRRCCAPMYVQHVVAITPEGEYHDQSQRSRITRVSGPVRPAWAIPEPRLRRHIVHHLPFHVSLRHRLRRRLRGAKSRRHRSRDSAATSDACGSRQSRTARHFRDPAQRHGAPRLQAYPDE